MVISGRSYTIGVSYHWGEVYAANNRCPHMGFPLDRSPIADRILTCHWYHTRFDLARVGAAGGLPATWRSAAPPPRR